MFGVVGAGERRAVVDEADGADPGGHEQAQRHCRVGDGVERLEGGGVDGDGVVELDQRLGGDHGPHDPGHGGARALAGGDRGPAGGQGARQHGRRSRSAADRRTLRLERASPSGSRTMGQPTTSTGSERSSARRRTTASCWKSFNPK